MAPTNDISLILTELTTKLKNIPEQCIIHQEQIKQLLTIITQQQQDISNIMCKLDNMQLDVIELMQTNKSIKDIDTRLRNVEYKLIYAAGAITLLTFMINIIR